MRRKPLLAATAAACLLMTGASPASAKERTVDDDKAQCPKAAYTSIQAAVNDSNPGDKIRVCPGTYEERVRITDKDRLKLESTKRWQAVIKWPATPSTALEPDPLVHIESSDDVDIDGFKIAGPYPEPACAPPERRSIGVYVDNSRRADITGNWINQIRNANPAMWGCQNGIAVQIGWRFDTSVGTADLKGNLIDDYEKGGVVVDGPGSYGDIDHNVVLASEDAQSIVAANGVQVGREAGGDVGHNAIARNKYTPQTFSGSGVIVFETKPDGVKVHHNKVWDNDVGLNADSLEGLSVTHNVFKKNVFDGVSLCGDSAFFCGPVTNVFVGFNYIADNDGSGIGLYDADDNTLAQNEIRRNGTLDHPFGETDGIHVDENSEENKIKHNRLRDNVEHDCHDDSDGTGTAGTANEWDGNDGVTENRPGLCEEKSQGGNDEEDGYDEDDEHGSDD